MVIGTVIRKLFPTFLALLCSYDYYYHTLEPKLLYVPQKRLEVTSSATVVLTAFLDSPNLPKEGLSGLKGKFSWHDT